MSILGDMQLWDSYKQRILNESFVSDLDAKYTKLPNIQSEYPKMMQYCIDWAFLGQGDESKILSRVEASGEKLHDWCTKYRSFAIQSLHDIHELEYKQSQIKRFYDRSDVLMRIDNTMMRIAKWLQLYLSVILFSRAALDGLYNSHGDSVSALRDVIKNAEDGIYPDPQTVIKNFGHIANGFDATGTNRIYDNYVTPIFMELQRAKTLPQLLVAITKAKNAEHDAGPIMTDLGTGLFFGNEEAFEEISNLNYRKLDRELQKEFGNHVDESCNLYGMADKTHTTESDVDADELQMGIKVEMEHTDDPAVAKQIALDHLAEDPHYYTKLKTIHVENVYDDFEDAMRRMNNQREYIFNNPDEFDVYEPGSHGRPVFHRGDYVELNDDLAVLRPELAPRGGLPVKGAIGVIEAQRHSDGDILVYFKQYHKGSDWAIYSLDPEFVTLKYRE